MKQLTLGSLFDGIGGFCYAAGIPSGIDTRCTIKPLWAAEVEPNCIDITRYRFKDVMHVGSVTELKGDEVQPVDIITFGSPCQDLSIAGKRKGLKGNRSGLFTHAIRIIREMRLATNGKYPTFIIWENVPGAFSSNNGEDFRAVLEKVTNANIPMPASGKWATAGMVRGGGRLTQLGESLTLNIGEYPSVENESTLSEILEDNVPEKYYLSPKACLGILRRAKNKGRKLPDNLRIALEQKVAEGGEVVGINPSQPSNSCFTDISPTLLARMGTGGNQVPCIAYEKKEVVGIDNHNSIINENIMGTLTAACGGTTNSNLVGYVEKKSVIPLRDEVTRNKASNGLGVGKVGGPCPTLTTADIHSVFYEAYQHNGYRESDTSGTLTAGQNNTVRGDTPLIVTDKKAFEENQHGGYRETQINGTLRAAGGSYGGGSETLITESTKTKGNIPSTPKKSIKDLLKKATQKVVYIIRRLTPVEGERLQGYPDDWTKYGADGNIIADTARYRAIGNSICVYCAERLYIGIIRILQEEEKDNERKDESLL